MRAWVITNGPSASTEDDAYLTGRLAMRFDALFVTGVDRDALDAPDCPGEVDIVVNRGRSIMAPEFHRALQRRADDMGVPLSNPGEAAIRSNDKRTYASEFAEMVPPTKTVSNETDLHRALISFGGDIVIKSPAGHGGRQVHRISSEAELKIGTALLAEVQEREIVVQPFLAGFSNGDRRILTVSGNDGEHQVIGALLRTPGPGQWKCNITSGGKGSVYEPDKAEIRFAQEAAEISGLDYAQLDIGWHDGNLFLIETNQVGGGYVDFDFGNRANSGDAVAAMIERLAQGRGKT